MLDREFGKGDVAAPPMIAESVGFEEFCRCEDRWNDLLLNSPSPLPFLSHTWICTWWKHFGNGQEFTALVLRDDSGWIAGVPLAVRSERAGGKMTVAEIVGTAAVPTRGRGLADKSDFLVRGGARDAAARLAGEVARLLDSIDALHVKGLDRDSPMAGLLRDAAPAPRSVRVLNSSTSPYLRLGGWDEYLSSRSQKFRKNLKRSRRLLEQIGPVELESMEPDQDCEAWLRDLFSVNDRSWKARRGTNLFRHPALRGFFADVIRQTARRSGIDLHLLRVDGKPAAYELGFDLGGRILAYNAAFDAELARCSPGSLVTAAVIASACERGRGEYDMLRGDESYKLRWSETYRTECQVLVPAASARARVRTFTKLFLKEKLRRVSWLSRLDDRISGMWNRVSGAA